MANKGLQIYDYNRREYTDQYLWFVTPTGTITDPDWMYQTKYVESRDIYQYVSSFERSVNIYPYKGTDHTIYFGERTRFRTINGSDGFYWGYRRDDGTWEEPIFNMSYFERLARDHDGISAVYVYMDYYKYPNVSTDTTRVTYIIRCGDGNYYVTVSEATVSDFIKNTKEPEIQPSGPDEGQGDYDGSSDPIPIPGLPTQDVLDTGIVRAYRISPSELNNLSHVLWSSDFIDSIKQFFTSPSEGIISLHVLPFIPTVSNATNVVIGNYSTNVQARPCTNQYRSIDMGTLNFNEYFGGYPDYNLTRVSIYLPFIGVHELNAVDVVGAELKLVYHIDILSGVAVAMLKVKKNRLDSTIYTWSGNMIQGVPLSATNHAEKRLGLVQGVLGLGTTALGVAASVASGGAAAPVAMGAVAGVTSGLTGIVNSQKDHYGRVNNISGDPSFIGVLQPYICVTRPRMSKPASYNNTLGIPSNITATLGSLTGYTQISSVHLEGIAATDSELSEIESLLKEGVII